MNDTEDLWISCAEALREQVSDAIWQAYLSGITPVSIKEHEIVLGVPNKLIRDRVESRFLGLIQDTVTGTLGRDLVVQLEVVAPATRTARYRAVADHRPRPARRPARPPARRPTPCRQCGPASVLAGARPPLHVRDLRHRLVQPVRPRRRPVRGRVPGPFLQPAVHLRGRRARQDPPPPRHRQLRARELQRPQRPLRHHRDLHERVRRRHPPQLDHRFQTPLPGVRRPAHRRRPVHGAQGIPPGGVLPHLQLPLRGVQADRPHLRPSAEVDRHPRGPSAQPVPVGPHHRGPATRARDPTRHPPDQGRARAGRRARRGPRVHRHPRQGEHPGARGGAASG